MSSNQKSTGTVKWFDPQRGMGYLIDDSGKEIFVHHTGIEGDGYTLLSKGQRVEFRETDTDHGQQATEVSAVAR